MEFKIIEKETTFLNPTKDMAQKSIRSEIRVDPLTKRTARICHFMKLKWQKPDFDQIVSGTEKNCPFCSDKVLTVTPCFLPEIIPAGRFISEDRVLFPNLAPYDSLGAVAIMGSRHYIPMTEIEPERIVGSFQLAMDFFRRIEQIQHPEGVYHIINWNYMPPSGSSIIHPHIQVFSTSHAPNLMRQELECAKIWMEKNGTNFWDDYMAHEITDGRRYLGKIGRTIWFTSFAPMGVAGDILAIVENVRCTLELTHQDLNDLATGLTRVMAAYDAIGIYSFNMNSFTGASHDDFTRFHILFSPRTFFNQALGTPDVGALQKLFNESICMAHPEEINEMVKPYFNF